ncbi:lipase family protein [Nocardia stercoris]|uniref:Lipase n=1 Tax=Nocardia stercoris TaxID=2483361 RepID=A0A3M2L1Z7_9NOCA|nr:lipase family protein [Nocardia stercoris]RMI30966.1 lipase [Nocardia stercoris]
MKKTRAWLYGIAGVLGGLALTLHTAQPAIAQPCFAAADPDPFFAAPGDIGDFAPGDVIDSKGMPPIPALPGVGVTLVKFRSSDSHGNPIAATTTVLTPPWRAPGSPLISYQAFINSLGSQCGVSKAIYSGDLASGIREVPMFNLWLDRGITIALPDHLGPTFAYGAAKLGGQITLDGIRAVQRDPQFGVANAPTVLAGYSGGGMTTGWAAALQPSYAPDLHLAGAAFGGAPENLVEMMSGIGYSAHPAFGLAFAAAIGLEREYPTELPISEHLNALGRDIEAQMSNSCVGQLLALGAGHSVTDFATDTTLADDPSVLDVLNQNSLDQYPGTPAIPIFEWHSPNDPLLPVDAIERTDGRWCAAGVPVTTLQFPIGEHLTTAVFGFPEALAWIESRISGVPAPSNC